MKAEIEKYIFLYSSDLTRFCNFLCSNYTDAEDLFQETWLKAMKKYHKYNHSLPFDKWLLSICANIYKDSLKLSYNRKRYHFSSEDESIQFLNSIPDKTAENQDFSELYNGLLSLPKKQKLVITLFYFKDYSIGEISEILKIPEGTVKSRLCNARKNLKRRLNNE